LFTYSFQQNLHIPTCVHDSTPRVCASLFPGSCMSLKEVSIWPEVGTTSMVFPPKFSSSGAWFSRFQIRIFTVYSWPRLLCNFILLYVDDILTTCPYSQAIVALITTLMSNFPIKDLGPIHYFLGVEVLHDANGLFLSQKQYILDLLKISNMVNAKISYCTHVLFHDFITF
jgi:hypothetical protein